MALLIASAVGILCGLRNCNLIAAYAVGIQISIF